MSLTISGGFNPGRVALVMEVFFKKIYIFISKHIQYGM